MGKNLQNKNLVTREKKVAFYEIPGKSAFERMEGFQTFSTSKSVTEHNPKYVDESSARTFVVGYDESISYSFDRYAGNEVQQDIIKITDEEKVGSDAIRRIVQVDMTTLNEAGTVARGRMRSYTVIPDSDGDDSNVMTNSGTLKCNGEWEEVECTSKDDWQSININVGNTSAPRLNALSVVNGTSGSSIALTPEFSPANNTYRIPATTSIRIIAKPEVESFNVIAAYNGKTYSATSANAEVINTTSGSSIAVIVTGNKLTSTYTISIAE